MSDFDVNSPKNSFSTNKITILVVDDDATSLAIVSAMLRHYWHYEVTTAKSPHDALFILRAHPGIDLVVTDLHMPHMDGLELYRQIDEEFQLPVVIMSADDKESVILQCLACGVVFYIVKPVNPDDLKNVWQYAAQGKNGKSTVIEEIENIELESSRVDSKTSSDENDHSQGANSVSSVTNNNGEKQAKNDGKKRRKGKDIVNNQNHIATKKPKVVWTNSLHNRFLHAIRFIGLDRAVPKKILECMNVPELTRENVASHLQKYRIFLKRVAEKGLCPSKVLTETSLRSTFAACHAMMLQNAQQEFLLSQQHMRGLTFHPAYGGYGGSNTVTSTLNSNSSPNFLTLRFPSQGASSSSSPLLGLGLHAHQYGYGQSNLWLNRSNMQQTLFGNTNLLNYQTNRPGFGVGSSNYGSNLSANGGVATGVINPSSNGLVSGANLNPIYMCPQQGIHARPDLYNVGNDITSSAQYQYGASNFTNFRTPNPNNIGATYSESRMTGNGEFGLGQFQFNSTANGNAGTGGYRNGSINVAPVSGNGNSGNVVQGSSFSVGFEQVPNQLSSQVPPLVTNNHQGSASQLPQMQEGLIGLGAGADNEFNFDNFLNNASLFDDNSIADLFDSSNLELPHQQQGGDSVLNPDITSSLNSGDLNQIVNQTLNPHESGAGSLFVDGNASWNEQALAPETLYAQNQTQGGDQLVNNNATGSNISPLGNPFVDHNASQPQNAGGATNLKANSIYPTSNASQNQGWGDDFLDSFFGGP